MYLFIHFSRGGGQEQQLYFRVKWTQSEYFEIPWLWTYLCVARGCFGRTELFFSFFFCTWTQLGVWCAHCFIRTRSRRFGRRAGAARSTGACLELLMGLWAAPRVALRERLIVISGQHLAGSGRREEDDAGRGRHMEENVTVHCHMFRSAQVEFIRTKKTNNKIITKTKENSFLLNWR